MRRSKFIIWYSDGTGLEEYATTMYEAVILSLAKKINNGLNYSIDVIENEDGIYYEIDNYMCFKKITG